MANIGRAFQSSSAGWIIASLVAIIGMLVATNTFEEIRIQDERENAEKSYYYLLAGLASDSPIERVGALGRLPSVLGEMVPVNTRPYLFEGLFYVLGLHDHDSFHAYHEDLIRVIRTLINTPKMNKETSEMESQALIEMLGALGASGWYKGIPKRSSNIKQESLAWIWQNALNERITDSPSFSLFRSSQLRELKLNRYQLDRADFSNSEISQSSFKEAILTYAQFRNANLESISFDNADLEKANFENASLRNVSFKGANLTDVSFVGTELKNIKWPTGYSINKKGQVLLGK